MKNRVISVLTVLGVVLLIFFGNTVQATENGIWFVFTSFGEITSVELLNETTGETIVLHEDELFDYETLEFISLDTQYIKLVKNYTDGTVIEQEFDVTGARLLVGIYDDGTCGESWMEIDEKYTY